MSEQANPNPSDSLVEMPLQPTGSGVADLEIAYEQMKLAQGAAGDSDTASIDNTADSEAPLDHVRRADPGNVAETMQLIRLPIGSPADVDTDCIRIEALEGGGHRLTGTALCAVEDEGASVSLMNGLTYATRDDAEAAGVAWADSVGVRRLYISVGTLDRPLRLMEIDLPG